MDKIYRDRADIAIAFSSAKKRHAIADAASRMPADPRATHLRAGLVAGEMSAELNSGRQGPVIKRVLRRIVRGVYRALRPVTRPVAFRIRSFLMAGQLQLAQDLHQQALNRLAVTEKALRTELNAINAKLQLELKNSQDQLRSTLIAEMAYTRELIQQSRSDWLARQRADGQHEAQHLERIETYAAAAARRNAVRCGDNEILVRTKVGYMVCPAHDHALLAQLLDTGEVEAGTRLLIERLLAPGSTYVDVGANIGMHTIAAARAMQGIGRIVCFEPFAATATLLRKSVFLNGFASIVKVHQAAVSSHSGSQPLFLGQTSGHHSLFPLDKWAASEDPPVETQLVRLDDALSSEARVDLIKIDAEGAELAVLAGAGALIENNPGIGLIVECGAAHLRRLGEDLSVWLGRFESLGFEWKVINPNTGRLAASARDSLLDSPSVNLFMARSGSRLWRLAEVSDA